jgi:hypothetical protein
MVYSYTVCIVRSNDSWLQTRVLRIMNLGFVPMFHKKFVASWQCFVLYYFVREQSYFPFITRNQQARNYSLMSHPKDLFKGCCSHCNKSAGLFTIVFFGGAQN